MNSRSLILASACAGLGAVLFLSGCNSVPYRVHDGKVDTVLEQKTTTGEFFYAIGMGAADPALKSDTQRKALSRDAAIVKAQYEMLAYLKGVTLKGGIKVSRAMEADSTIESNIEQLIKGAEIVRSEYTEDNGCVVTIRLPAEEVYGGVGDVAWR